MDGAEYEEVYNINYEKAISNDLITNNEKIKSLKEDGSWTDQDEYNIKDQERFIDTMKISKTKVALDSQVEQINKAIIEAEQKINELLSKKDKLMGFTAEKYALKKQNDALIFNSLYRDEEL